MTIPVLLLAASLPKPSLPAATGRWSIASTFAMGGLPVSPPPRTVERCVTDGDREDPRPFLAAIGAPEDDCRIEGWSIEETTVRWKAECSGRYRGPAAGALTFSGSAARGELTIAVEDSRGARHPVRYRIDASRRGDCSR